MRTFFRNFLLAAMLLMLFVVSSKGQTTVTIGTGTLVSNYPYTTFWMDGRTEILFTSTELLAGGAAAGNITQIGFNVIGASAQLMNGFNIKMQTTTQTSLTGFVNTGWTTVYSTPYTVPATGWQMITLTTPFAWNGTSNLLIEICYDNTAYTAYSTVNATAATGMTWGYYTDGAAGCTMTGGSLQANRPNTRLVFCSTPAQPSIITGLASPCIGSSQNYSVTNVPGTTYTWTFPTGWAQTAGGTTNAITVTVGSGTGNISVTPSNACGNGTARTLAVTPTDVPAQPSTITGNATPYYGTSENYSVTNVPGTTYTWTFPTGWVQTAGGTTNAVTVTIGNGSGNVSCLPSNACGNGTPRTLAVTVVGVGIKEVGSGMSIIVNPNPTKGIVTINFNGYTGDINLSIYNSLGIVVSSEVISAVNENSMKTLDISKYPNGVYYLKFVNNGKTYVEKIAKQ